ncbi:hypothetical protein AB205_0142080, partial [Aquarana catesbeiana]
MHTFLCVLLMCLFCFYNFSYAVIAYGCASCPRLTCEREGCQTEFCYHCKQVWHPNQTCDMARQQRAPLFGIRRKHPSGISYGQESGSADDMKSCPRCSAYIIKMNDGSCNHMTCAVCGCEFCWLCMKEISDLHYLRFCLGDVHSVGSSQDLFLRPMYFHRRIHGRLENKKTSKHKKNLAVTGGVILSVIASPVVAAVSVGIGVPIMLAYVYGVVPVSLCRGGGCGVSTANGKGVKIDFEEDGPITVADAWRALKNPSIGESSMEGLTSVLSTSGSPTDGLSVLQGNYSETASFAALSGGTLTGGTLTGGMLSGGRAKYCRLEVQADVQKDTCQKDSVSLGAVSDSASTRAMAGSIISSYNPQERYVLTLDSWLSPTPIDSQLYPPNSNHTHSSAAENTSFKLAIDCSNPAERAKFEPYMGWLNVPKLINQLGYNQPVIFFMQL